MVRLPRYECPKNEEYLLCGSACPYNCTNPPESVVCAEQCIEGCFCKSGYLRADTGTCVPMEECVKEPCTKENEIYDMCNAGCEPSCKDPDPVCTKVCNAGCVCSAGLLRTSDGLCVSVDKCLDDGNYTSPVSKYLNAINKILHLSYV
ncbi:serine protease inhibitor swm-1-like [Battus philenor]|uniref:serine protease inhibitor swm-1-like n=1 Tax=Battus philenor TaxID=42288 RepID=UPI0035CFDE76